MKERLAHWPSTIPGILVIAFLSVCVFVKPELLNNPETLILLGTGIAALLWKSKDS